MASVLEVGALQVQARELAEAGGEVVVECTELEHLDAAALQVLVALAAALRAGGGRLWLRGVPAPVARYLALAGGEALGLAWEPMAAEPRPAMAMAA